MSVHATLLRQLHLVQLLRHARTPLPFSRLQRHILEHSSAGDLLTNYTQRTFQRDAQQMQETFGVTIRHRRGQGYYLHETDLLPDGHQRLLEAVELREFLRLPTQLAGFVQPETRPPLGLEHLRPLLRAAQARQLVAFTYRKYWEDAPYERTAGPLLLKEFRGRWYVLALMPDSGYLACFGLDRISHLSLIGRPFAPPADFDAASYYRHAFGIIRPNDADGLPVDIILRFSLTQGRYALGQPLHASQRLLLETTEEICLGLYVYDTHDLRMELLSYGPEVEVLAPPELRDWLQQVHAEAGALASNGTA
ncbi:WYL domain-containing protein [Hymenobacter gummosus]|uniref:WYL domain-containing protein n=1 Tax=Hymenobacter gummosus TaxID=1776032 RepID=A0A431U6J3_9BACT|nr:WYL domain-containing protein [Hymenobacter gummosus]RTQ52329.1 WYL domain-containing protein [Hymenobacter gummosus]